MTNKKVKSNKERLIETSKHGGVTLVLGAGISRPYGVPNWEDLAKRVWEIALPDRKSPWDAPIDMSPCSLPQFLPIVFEMALEKLKLEKFIEVLSKCIYGNVKVGSQQPKNSKTTLETIARTIAQEYAQGSSRRIVRVITFNVDDLLERTIRKFLESPRQGPAHQTIARAGRHPRWDRGNEPISIYHLHGFIPRMRMKGRKAPWLKNYDHMLVFSDSQYWDSSSKMLSFTNRVMGHALHDSHCVFIGLSMTDINLLRWLAVIRNEHMNEWMEISRRKKVEEPGLRTTSNPTVLGLRRHFWIRPNSDDPTDFLSDFLKTRGVRPVAIRSWEGVSFENLFLKCFPLNG